MKKTLIISVLMMAAAAVMTGCVPGGDATTVEVNPDFHAKDNIKLDFNQLHNDAIDGIAAIDNGEPFVFIADLDIDGDADTKTLTVRATAIDGTSEDDCENFASALLCQINDAAVSQDPKYEPSSSNSFGTLYDDYTIDFAVSDENNGGFIYSLNVPAGEEIGLDPDYEKYVEQWEKELEIYKSNLVYDANGNVVRDGNE